MDLAWRMADRTLTIQRPLAAGIVNVTEDSMFAGARSGTPEQAIADGIRLAEAGFDMIDIGAIPASTGEHVPPAREAAKLLPSIEGLADAIDLPISVDTFSAEVAHQALDAGAVVVNDISGGIDPETFDVVAEADAGYVLMHIEGPPRVFRKPPRFDDPIDHLKSFFTERIEEAVGRGVDPEQIVIDPGIDFDIGVEDGLEVLRRLGELGDLGRPIFLSISRKDLIGAVLGGSWEDRLGAEDREWGTAAATALGVAAGAQIHRLHDESALQALRIAAAITWPGSREAGFAGSGSVAG